MVEGTHSRADILVFMSLDATTLHYSFLFNGSHVVIRAGLFFGHLKKNSRSKKLKTQEKNSKLKLKIQISGTFEENGNFGKLTETTIIVKRGTERPKF